MVTEVKEGRHVPGIAHSASELKALEVIRNSIVVLLVLLVAQFWLGMTINLEINLPVEQLGAVQSLEYFGRTSIFVLVHITNAFLILGASILLLVTSFKSSLASLKVIALVELASVIGATVNGVLFLESGQSFGWSVGMAMSAVGVLISAAVDLYFVGKNLGRIEVAAS